MNPEASRVNILRNLATCASIAALAVSAKAGIFAATAEAQTSSGDPVALCESEALASVGAPGMAFDTANNLAVETVVGNALPANCDGVVWRTVSVQQVSGPNTNNLSPNTASSDVYDGNGSFNNTVNQSMSQPWSCGVYYESQATVYVTPVSQNTGDNPETQIISTNPEITDCTTSTSGGGSGGTGSGGSSGGGNSGAQNGGNSETVQQCEQDAVTSFTHANAKYLRPRHGKFNRIQYIVKALALPSVCNSEIERVIYVQSRLGKRGHIKPDSGWNIVSTSGSSVDAKVTQVLRRAWRRGEKTQDVLAFEAVPMQAYAQAGAKPLTKLYTSRAA